MKHFIIELWDTVKLSTLFILYSLAMMVLSVAAIAGFVVLMGWF